MHVGLIINSKHLKELRTSKQYLLVPSSFPTRHILGPGIYLGRKGGEHFQNSRRHRTSKEENEKCHSHGENAAAREKKNDVAETK